MNDGNVSKTNEVRFLKITKLVNMNGFLTTVINLT